MFWERSPFPGPFPGTGPFLGTARGKQGRSQLSSELCAASRGPSACFHACKIDFKPSVGPLSLHSPPFGAAKYEGSSPPLNSSFVRCQRAATSNNSPPPPPRHIFLGRSMVRVTATYHDSPRVRVKYAPFRAAMFSGGRSVGGCPPRGREAPCFGPCPGVCASGDPDQEARTRVAVDGVPVPIHAVVDGDRRRLHPSPSVPCSLPVPPLSLRLPPPAPVARPDPSA